MSGSSNQNIKLQAHNLFGMILGDVATLKYDTAETNATVPASGRYVTVASSIARADVQVMPVPLVYAAGATRDEAENKCVEALIAYLEKNFHAEIQVLRVQGKY
ncbi:hypothetical protein D9611_001376 [Ephemerocybe angulata]|uniref:Uncharacterized protein n=1 Tax=Ephemerocybe angulata TaxID=980116 RepID=A0A8H5CHE8_9AGAR|nr:hypothetical protein D9611_001376 [Tulosesus angulatus]